MNMEEIKELFICGRNIKLGDELKVRYTTGHRFKGSIIKGKVIKLWNGEDDCIKQAQLSNGWCFHNHDEIL